MPWVQGLVRSNLHLNVLGVHAGHRCKYDLRSLFSEPPSSCSQARPITHKKKKNRTSSAGQIATHHPRVTCPNALLEEHKDLPKTLKFIRPPSDARTSPRWCKQGSRIREMSHQKVTRRNAQGFSKVATKCSMARIYVTCKCQSSKLQGKELHKKKSIIELVISLQEDLRFCRHALLVLRLVWLVARIRGCLLWLTAAAASVVGSVKSVCSGGSAEAGLEVEAPVVHRAG